MTIIKILVVPQSPPFISPFGNNSEDFDVEDDLSKDFTHLRESGVDASMTVDHTNLMF
jgi:hypothetical protein